MGIDSRKAFAFVIAAQALLLAAAVALFLHGEHHARFPAAITVVQPGRAVAIVPVRYSPPAPRGVTRTQAAALARGGRAAAAVNADAGFAGRTATSRLRAPR